MPGNQGPGNQGLPPQQFVGAGPFPPVHPQVAQGQPMPPEWGPVPGPAGAAFGQPGIPGRPSASTGLTSNGVLLGVLALATYAVVELVVFGLLRVLMTTVSGPADWFDVVYPLMAAVPTCWAAATVVLAVDTRIRRRTGAAVAAAIVVFVTLIDTALLIALFVTDLESSVLNVLTDSIWYLMRNSLTVAFLIGGWVMARRVSPVALIAAVVGGAVAYLFQWGHLQLAADPDSGPFSFVYSFVTFVAPLMAIVALSCWLAVGIDKLASRGQPAPSGQR